MGGPEGEDRSKGYFIIVATLIERAPRRVLQVPVLFVILGELIEFAQAPRRVFQVPVFVDLLPGQAIGCAPFGMAGDEGEVLVPPLAVTIGDAIFGAATGLDPADESGGGSVWTSFGPWQAPC